MTLDQQLQLISDSDLSISNKSGCKLMTYVLHLIQDAPVPLKRKELVEQIREECPLTDFEREKSEGKDFERWEVYFSTFPINYSKAGFLIRGKDGWTLTDEGVEFLEKNDPVEMLREAMRRYRKWEKENPKKKKEIRDADELPEAYKIWLMAPGENANLWDAFQDNGEISIGWDDAGDLAKLPTLKSCTEKINDLLPDGTNHSNIGRCLWEFAHKMNPGDILIMKEGRRSYIGVGVVTSHYIWNDEAIRHKSIRKASWIKTGRWAVEGMVNQKTLTEVSADKASLESTFQLDFDQVRKLAFEEGFEGLQEDKGDASSTHYGIDDLLKESFLEIKHVAPILTGLAAKKNIILQGPPGTGKTYIAKRLAYVSMKEKDDDRLEVVQFHQSYSYEDFIQGFRPREGGGFERRDGVFFRFCDKARRDPGRDYFFLIDEINRGNLSKIFGELMMLIEADKRGESVQLTYSKEGEHFSIPENVHIIGTMNTADRSLAMVDYALRRRFAFFRMPPQFNDKFEAYLQEEHSISAAMVKCIVDKVTALNETIDGDDNLGDGFEIGHSYLCTDVPKGSDEETWYAHIVDHEIGPQLREYWFDDKPKAEAQIKLLKA